MAAREDGPGVAPWRRSMLPGSHVPALLEALASSGRRVVGPRLRDDSIVYDTVGDASELPRGWTDVQEAGTCRLQRRDDDAWFGFTPGFDSWKRLFHPARQVIWEAQKRGRSFSVRMDAEKSPRLALLGVRACELHALAMLDRVFLGRSLLGTAPVVEDGRLVPGREPQMGASRSLASPHYAALRGDVLVVATNCTKAGGTCFCASMGTGPRVTFGFDLLLTELADLPGHPILVEAGTAAGEQVLDALPPGVLREATPEIIEQVEARLARVEQSMGRQVDTDGLPAALARSLESPRWESAGRRCLACGNCTMVCPTCFCSCAHDEGDWSGGMAQKVVLWDSCFNLDFSYVYGGSIRLSAGSRYRQWLMHKFAWWHEQFGTSGCVGCGRCITWCPTGMDVTDEIRELQGGGPRER